MKPSDIFREVAEQEARSLRDGQLTPERERYEIAEKELRDRAAIVLDSFDARGELRASAHNRDHDRVRVIASRTTFYLPAPKEIINLIDPHLLYKQVVMRLTLGAHDLRFLEDDGNTWSDIIRCASLDALTTIEGIEHEEGLEEGVNELFTRLERLNYNHPVLDSYYSDSNDRIKEGDHFQPTDVMHAIEGFHGFLDLADEYLANPKNLA